MPLSDLLVVSGVVGWRNLHDVIRHTFGVDGGAAPILRNE